MKNLALALSIFPLALASCASSAPERTEAPAPAPKTPESSSLEVQLPVAVRESAYTAMVACLKSIQESAGTAGISIQSIRSQLTPAADGPGSEVDVTLDLIFTERDQVGADLAFEAARSAVATLVQSGFPEASYEDAKNSFIELRSMPPSLTGGALEAGDPDLGVHRATLEVTLPLLESKAKVASGASASGVVSSQSLARFVRSTAQSDQVRMPVSISAPSPSKNGLQTYSVRPVLDPDGSGDDPQIDRARIANFLHLLESGSRKTTISLVELKQPKGDGFAYFETGITVPNSPR